MTGPTLFDAAPVALPEVPRRTAGEIRRARQAEAIARGQHPLAVALRISLPLLGGEQTCGQCHHRQLVGGHARDFPKCWWTTDPEGKRHPRITGGPGTDVRKTWPACRDFQPKPVSR